MLLFFGVIILMC